MFLIPRYIPRLVTARTCNLVMSANNNKRQQQAIESLRKISKDTKIPRINTADVEIVRPIVPVGMSSAVSGENNSGNSLNMSPASVTVLEEPDKSMRDQKKYR